MLFELQGLRVRNDYRQSECTRPLALDIASLRVVCRDRVFVLADNYNGKGPLGDALFVLVNWHQTEAVDLGRPNLDGRTQEIHVDHLLRGSHATCRKQEGSTDEDIAALRAIGTAPHGSFVLNYADDPCRAREVIDIAYEYDLTLLIGSDPDRLPGALGHFLAKRNGRILWLDRGVVFWDGTVDAFCAQIEALLRRYIAHQQATGYCGAGKNFPLAIQSAIRGTP